MDAAGQLPHAGLIAHIWRLPLTRMLMLSLGLHAAVVMIVQPRPYPQLPEVMVISARLLDKKAEPVPAEALPAAPEPPLPEPLPEPPAPAPEPSPPLPTVADEPAVPLPVAAPQPAPAALQPAAPQPAAVVEPTPPPVPRPQSAGSDLPSIPVMVDNNWYEARQLDVQPKAVAAIKPIYPPYALRRGIEGTVKLRLRIDEFGVVQDAEVEEGDPPGVFDASALEAFRQGQFRPAGKDGRPVRARIEIRVRYELGD